MASESPSGRKRRTPRQPPASLSETNTGGDQAATGSVEQAVQAHIEALRHEDAFDTEAAAHGAAALRLARWLDAGEPPYMTAQWAKELRATLDAMRQEAGGDDQDEDGWVGGLASTALPPAVRDPKEP